MSFVIPPFSTNLKFEGVLFMVENRKSTRDDFLKDLILQFIDRRLELGLSQSDIDVTMGNSDRLVSKWECGDRTPTSFNLFCWAEAVCGKLILS